MPKRPNVLLITADQMRGDAMHCAGDPVIQTPNLDRLAASGVYFPNAYTPSPICVPARASITTGNIPAHATGCTANAGRIHEDQPRIAHHFNDAGYATYALGKLHYVPYSPPGTPRLLHGFQHCEINESGRMIAQFDPTGRTSGIEDYFDYLAECGWPGYTRAHGIGNNDVRPCPTPLPAELAPDHWVADRTIAALDGHQSEKPDQPFFMWASFSKPHSPYDPPDPWHRMYDPREVPAPVGDDTMLEGRSPRMVRDRATHAFDSLSPEARRVSKAYYYGLISFQDAQVGRLLDELDRRGLADDTIVLYTADHGDLMGDFGMFFKTVMYEGSVRVPFIVRAPGATPSGVVRNQMVGLEDVLPTLAALTGTTLSHEVDGLDLTAAMSDPKVATRDLYFSVSGKSPEQTAMAYDGRFKFIWSEANGTVEFYDRDEDPREMRNLASSDAHAETRERLRRALIDWARNAGVNDLLDPSGDDLLSTPVDVEAWSRSPVSGMGWRWY